MTASQPIGPLIQSFFVDHLVTVKGLRPASVRSYRDTIRLLLGFVARDNRSKITKLTVDDLTLRPDRRLPAPPRRRAPQPRPHPQPAAGRAAHPVRLHRGAGSPRCSACASGWPPSR